MLLCRATLLSSDDVLGYGSRPEPGVHVAYRCCRQLGLQHDAKL
jgi:hypothetical protein